VIVVFFYKHNDDPSKHYMHDDGLSMLNLSKYNKDGSSEAAHKGNSPAAKKLSLQLKMRRNSIRD
jgi:hypothetical protein